MRLGYRTDPEGIPGTPGVICCFPLGFLSAYAEDHGFTHG
jgi:hypothetical protein